MQALLHDSFSSPLNQHPDPPTPPNWAQVPKYGADSQIAWVNGVGVTVGVGIGVDVIVGVGVTVGTSCAVPV